MFRRGRNATTVPSYLAQAGSELHRLGASTEKARVPAFVFTRGNVKNFKSLGTLLHESLLSLCDQVEYVYNKAQVRIFLQRKHYTCTRGFNREHYICFKQLHGMTISIARTK